MILDGAAASAPTDVIKDTDTQNFAVDVIEASQTTPVIVDFWAPWCGPCKQLGPALEKVVTEAGGKVKMVKINVDENQQLAGQMRVQSIPTVYAFFQGQPVDGFAGAQPESQLRQFVDKLSDMSGGQSPVEAALAQAAEMGAMGQYAPAVDIYAQVLQHEPDNLMALAGLLEAYIALGEMPQAAGIWDTLPDDVKGAPELAAVKASLELAEQAASVDNAEVAALEAKLTANPEDYQARFDLALALMASDEMAAVDHLVTIVRKDRDWKEDGARTQLMTMFEAWGATDPRTVKGRRKLSSALFS